MLRDKWEFEYTASALADAAEKQRDFRKSRVELWEGKKEEVIRKIKESGLTVHEDIADLLSNQTLGKYNNTRAMGMGAQVMVDATLQQDLSECVGKIRHHQELQASYNAWAQVLRANPENRLKLTHDDWAFFFGK